MLLKLSIKLSFAFVASALIVLVVNSNKTSAADYPFPVIGSSSYINDFNAPRANGKHNAIDIIANKHQKIVSRTDGVITYAPTTQPSWGFMIIVKADNGNEYNYIHMNNDTPGTDNGRGGPFYAYGPDIEVGNRVVKGQLLGYVGDSGNAEETVPHLHFEVYKSNGQHTNPYNGLKNNSYRITKPNQNYPTVRDEFLPSSASFMGGYTLAMGNVDGEDGDEIIVGPGKGGRWVKVFNSDGTLLSKFTPNGVNFLGGVDVAAGDVDGDGVDEIITGANKGGRFVKVFKSDGTQIGRFAPHESNIGVNVAVGNFDSDPKLEIVTGAPKGSEPRVGVYNLDGELLSSFNVYSSGFRGGVQVEAANLRPSNPYDEIVTLSEEGGLPHAKISSMSGSHLGWTHYFAEEWWQGNYDLVVSDEGDMFASMGINRRSTVRPVFTGM